MRPEIAEPDVLLSETLCLRISPELKQELQEYAAERKRELSDLLIEAFVLLMRVGVRKSFRDVFAGRWAGRGRRREPPRLCGRWPLIAARRA